MGFQAASLWASLACEYVAFDTELISSMHRIEALSRRPWLWENLTHSGIVFVDQLGGTEQPTLIGVDTSSHSVCRL